MGDKQKFPADIAKRVARELADLLAPVTEKVAVAGSLRRQRSEVGDLELLFIPKFEPGPRTELFGEEPLVNLADRKLQELLDAGVIAKRATKTGSEPWGEQIKFARHVETGLPVDLFTASSANWFNYLVCRIGPAASNIRIAAAAKTKGWKWAPYSAGFEDSEGQVIAAVASQEDVFRLVGLPYREPWQRY